MLYVAAMIKYGLLVLGFSGLFSIAVKAFAPTPPVADVQVLAVSSPREIATGQRYSVHGGLRLPAGRYERRFRICQHDCRSSGWGIVQGPDEWWGRFGTLDFDEPGKYDVSLILYTSDTRWPRAVSQVSWQVTVD